MTLPNSQLLAFDTSTDVLSVALSSTHQDRTQTWMHTGVGGAQASSGLIAAALDLLSQAGLALQELDAICFGSGPGSFTGLRTACAVAQGFAYGAGVPVLPIPSLWAIAQEARQMSTNADTAASLEVVAMLDARMGEIYAARYAFNGRHWAELTAPCLMQPEGLGEWLSAPTAAPLVLAGNVFTPYAAQFAAQGLLGAVCLEALPTAQAMLQLAPSFMQSGHAIAAEQALPLYIRNKVAKTTAERALEKIAKTHS